MDVTCERCRTEYEFEDTLVSDRGTAVRCTQCGNIFRVFRPGATLGRSQQDGQWKVRVRNGNIFFVTSLRELQRLISSGELTEDDEIARTGGQWKPFGKIPELRSFFGTAQRQKSGTLGSSFPPPADPNTAPSDAHARQPTMQGTGLRQPTIHGVGQSPLPPGPGTLGPGTSSVQTAPTVPISSPPIAPATPRPPVIEIPRAAAAPPSIGATESVPSEAMESGPVPTVSEEDLPHAADSESSKASEGSNGQAKAMNGGNGAPHAPHPAASSRADVTGAFPMHVTKRGFFVSEQDDVGSGSMPNKSNTLRIPLVIAMVLVVGVAFAWRRVAKSPRSADFSEKSAKFLRAGDQALAKDYERSYEIAIREYTRASAVAENNPSVMFALSKTQGAWAQSLAFQASDLDARSATDLMLAGEAKRIRYELAQHAEAAKQFAEQGLVLDSNSAEGELLLGDAFRLQGRLADARNHLEKAQRMEPTTNAQRNYLMGLLAMDEAKSNPAAALTHAEQAVQMAPQLIRARLLLARAFLAQKNSARATEEIAAVLQQEPKHADAIALQRAMQNENAPTQRSAESVARVQNPSSPPEALTDSTEPATKPDPVPSDTEGEVATKTASSEGSAEAASENAEPPKHSWGKDYGWHVSEGEEALDQNKLKNAREHFQTALAIRPHGSEAAAGLGYLSLQQGDARAAVTYFLPAATAGYGEALIGLGQAYRTLGQTADAIKAYESYLERRPTGPRASIARRQLDMLRQDTSSSNGSSGASHAASSEEDDTRSSEPARFRSTNRTRSQGESGGSQKASTGEPR